MDIKKINLTKWWFIIFITLFFISTVPQIGHDIYMYDVDKQLISVNLKAEQSKCRNIYQHNIEDLPDFINYERAGSDKNAFAISDRCYSLMNNYNTVYKKAIKEFFMKFTFGILSAILFTIIIASVIILVLFIMKKADKISDDEDEDDDYPDWY